MKKWRRRIRAAIGMGLIWGAAASCVAFLCVQVFGVNTDLPLAFLFAPLGFAAGIIFSAILVAFEGRRGFERSSVSRFAIWGAASGLLLTGIIVLGAALRGESMVSEFLLFGPPLAIAGAVCAAGSLAVARRTEPRELRDDRRHLLGAEFTNEE